MILSMSVCRVAVEIKTSYGHYMSMQTVLGRPEELDLNRRGAKMISC